MQSQATTPSTSAEKAQATRRRNIAAGRLSPATAPLLVNEYAAAATIGMSLAFLRKDRRNKRSVPFCVVGGTAIRYSPAALNEWVAAQTRGGLPASEARP